MVAVFLFFFQSFPVLAFRSKHGVVGESSRVSERRRLRVERPTNQIVPTEYRGHTTYIYGLWPTNKSGLRPTWLVHVSSFGYPWSCTRFGLHYNMIRPWSTVVGRKKKMHTRWTACCASAWRQIQYLCALSNTSLLQKKGKTCFVLRVLYPRVSIPQRKAVILCTILRTCISVERHKGLFF